ncbi:hypothetical protein [Deinococcus depolymerans]|uniref:Uncharacterized protein n=1 Tax=Deinococcus depolymerans TaxID=392408 RepID=A0ABP3LQW6_9DEIO
MTDQFRTLIARALPSPERVQESLRQLSPLELQAAADFFSVTLPEFDVAVALPGAQGLAQAAAELRGAFLVTAGRTAAGRWELFAPDLAGITRELGAGRRPARAALFTPQLKSGLKELEVLLTVARPGWLVPALAAGVARTDALGRARLELQGVRVVTPVMLADTPTGLVFERRYPHSA